MRTNAHVSHAEGAPDRYAVFFTEWTATSRLPTGPWPTKALTSHKKSATETRKQKKFLARPQRENVKSLQRSERHGTSIRLVMGNEKEMQTLYGRLLYAAAVVTGRHAIRQCADRSI